MDFPCSAKVKKLKNSERHTELQKKAKNKEMLLKLVLERQKGIKIRMKFEQVLVSMSAVSARSGKEQI